MKYEIQRSFDKAGPAPGTAARIYSRVLNQAAAPEQPRRPAGLLRRLPLIAAGAAALALLATGGYAAYQHWQLPEPTAYGSPDQPGIYVELDTRRYSQVPDETPVPAEPTALSEPAAPADPTAGETGAPAEPVASLPAVPAEPSSPAEPVTEAGMDDARYIRQAVELWRQVGLEADPEELVVADQQNLYWGRDEVEVRFLRGEVKASVTFDRDSGQLVRMSGIDWQPDGAAACATHAEADALAERCYRALPVPQGYKAVACTEYDEQFWSYDFCREVEPGICNPYEMVRISVNPVSGRMTGCNVFDVPLLDDHEPGQARISREEAEAAARACAYLDLEGYTLTGAEIAVGLPNYQFTAYQDANLQASRVTRWVWQLDFTGPNTEFADQYTVLVDCYTGEILGGGGTK